MSRTERKEREIARTRADILEGAARAFARKGYQGATMEDIAGEAGFAVGSLYNYFKGKDEIYRSLLQMIADEFNRLHQEPMLQSLAFGQRLEWLMQQDFELMERRRELFQTGYLLCLDR